MRVGFEVFQRLSSTYSLFRGGRVNATVAEVFPMMARDLLRREGLRFDPRGRASQTQRFLPDDWRPE